MAEIDVTALSSEQISQVLDRLIFMMLDPLVHYTDYGFELAASLLALLQNNRRRVCEADRHVVSERLFMALCCRDRDALISTLHDSRFERNLILYYVGLIVSATGREGVTYERQDVGTHRTYVVPDFPPRLTVEFEPLQRYLISLHRLYDDFRALIIARYTKIIVSQASKIVWRKKNIGTFIDRHDALQNCTLAAIKALDKFHSTQGTLTTYLTKWVSYSMSSNFFVGVGESYTVTRNARTRIATGALNLNNRSVDLEKGFDVADNAETGEQALINNEYIERLSRFMSRTGLARRLKLGTLLCGVPYVLTDAERALLKQNGDAHDAS